MSTPIKTGAWVLIAERGEYYRCDLYEYHDTVLIARVNPFSMRRTIADDEGLWATMHTYEDMFVGASENCAITYVSTEYSLHYMMQMIDGRWQDVELRGAG